jgi:16S rRNA (cytidine1402-2'-O)-methyltransferase
MNGMLTVVGTPIGNLGDFSPRAVEALEKCDFIAVEDTRVTVKLLNHFGIKKEMISYHEHNIRERGELIVSRILKGENCVIATDAGMPAISDPGEDLVNLCHEHGIKVQTVPGPTAFASAVALSGLPSGRFTFEGFLSVNKRSRHEHLESLKDEKRTMVFYEAPHKVVNTLNDMANKFGDRRVALVREITKIHEETCRTTLFDAIKKYETLEPRGEFVIVLEGKQEEAQEVMSVEDATEIALEKISQGFSPTAAAKEAAKLSGLKKGDIYKKIIESEENNK